MIKGCEPSNVGQGYILRRLIRRAVRHAKKLGIEGKFLSQIALLVVDMYKDTYSELEQNKEFIFTELEREEEKFSTTLQKGEHEFEKLLVNLLKGKSRVISGRIAFKLYDTFGFPIELTQELATEHGFSVDVKGFDEAFENIRKFRDLQVEHSKVD